MENDNLTNEVVETMPIVSHCVDDIQNHYIEGCKETEFDVLTSVNYPKLVNYDETAATISYEYTHVRGTKSCTVDYTDIQGSKTITFPKNESFENYVNLSSAFTVNQMEIPYYMVHDYHHVNSCQILYFGSNYYTEFPVYAEDDFGGAQVISNGDEKLIFDRCLTKIHTTGDVSRGSSGASFCDYNYLEFPDSVTDIQGFIEFNGTSVSIPRNVTNIGDFTFFRCNNLSTVYLYCTNLSYIGGGSFCNGGRQMKLYFYGITTPPTLGTSSWPGSPTPYTYGVFSSNCIIYVPSSSVNAYKEAWPSLANQIKSY